MEPLDLFFWPADGPRQISGTFTYNQAGELKTIARTHGSNTFNSTYQYDNAGRLTSLAHVGPGSVDKGKYLYAYDAADRITRKEYADGQSYGGYGGPSAEVDTFEYDAADELIAADHGGTQADETYSYDANGNRTNSGYTTGIWNRVTNDGTYGYTYDNEGNRTGRTPNSVTSLEFSNRESRIDYRGSVTAGERALKWL